MGKVVIMARDPSPDGDGKWATQYKSKAPSKRDSVSVSPATDWIGMVPLVRSAAKLAGQDGTVAFLGGHGRPCPPTDPFCMQNPQMNFSIELCTPNIVLERNILFYKQKTPPSISLEKNDNDIIQKATQDPSLKAAARAARQRQQKRKAYDDIGGALRENKVQHVLLLACRCSIGTLLLKQLAADWGVRVSAYNLRLALQQVKSRIRLYFDGDTPDTGSNTADAETEIPYFGDEQGVMIYPNGMTQTWNRYYRGGLITGPAWAQGYRAAQSWSD